MKLSPGIKCCLLVAAIAYGAFFLWYHCPYAGGSDSSGYLNSGKLLLAGELSAPVRPPPGLPTGLLDPEHYAPPGMKLINEGQRLAPTYPVGLPLHLATAGWVVGIEHAPTAVSLFTLVVIAWLLYLTGCRLGVRPAWSIAGTIFFLLSPLTLFYALQPMSDLLATAWIVVMIYCALRAQQHIGWAFTAGAALAVAVLVRPTNLVLAVPALIALPFTARNWLAFGLGGLPGALLLGTYNHHLYGSAFSNGYGSVSGLFAASWVGPTLRHYAVWIPVVLTPAVFAALALPFRPISVRTKLLLITWTGSLLIFYSTYSCTHETWWYLRFILPALPALVIAACLVLQDVRLPAWVITSRLEAPATTPASNSLGTRLRITPPGLLLIMGLLWLLAWGRHFQVRNVELDERAYRLIGEWAANTMPADAVLAAHQVGGAVFFYSDRPVLRPDLFTPESYARFNDYLAQNRLTLYAALFPYEEKDALQRHMPGHWEPVTRFRQITLWRRVGSAPRPATPAHASQPIIQARP